MLHLFVRYPKHVLSCLFHILDFCYLQLIGKLNRTLVKNESIGLGSSLVLKGNHCCRCFVLAGTSSATFFKELSGLSDF